MASKYPEDGETTCNRKGNTMDPRQAEVNSAKKRLKENAVVFQEYVRKDPGSDSQTFTIMSTQKSL